MSLWNVQGPLLHSGDHIVPHILTVDYTVLTGLIYLQYGFQVKAMKSEVYRYIIFTYS